MFKLFARGSLRSIVSQIKQSPYSLNEYLSNIENFKAKKPGDCVICLCEIEKIKLSVKQTVGIVFISIVYKIGYKNQVMLLLVLILKITNAG